jgi:hypothetical protein
MREMGRGRRHLGYPGIHRFASWSTDILFAFRGLRTELISIRAGDLLDSREVSLGDKALM